MNYGDRVTPGHICFSCARYQTKSCPAGNHLPEKKGDPLLFTGVDKSGNKTVFGCELYVTITEEYIQMSQASNNSRIIEASQLKDSDLDVALYRMIRATSPVTQKKLFDYWSYLCPKEYAKEMVDDTNGTKAKIDDNKNIKKRVKKKKNIFQDDFKIKEKKNV